MLPIPSDVARGEQRVAEIGATVPFVEPAAAGSFAAPFLSRVDRAATFTVLGHRWRRRQRDAGAPAAGPAARSRCPTRSCRAVGSTSATRSASTVRDCGSRSSSTTSADQPDPLVLVRLPRLPRRRPPAATVRRRGRSLRRRRSPPFGGTAFDEYRVVDRPAHPDRCGGAAAGYATATEDWRSAFPVSAVGLERNELSAVIARAISVQRRVSATWRR